MPSTPADSGLSPEQEQRIGIQNAALMLDRVSWVVRRREAIEISDETSLRRQITVDFSLPELLPDETPLEEFPDRGHCAPLLVLPKKPSNFMSFDLIDDKGNTMPLPARLENARISAATLQAMATRVLGREPAEGLSKQLNDIARAKAAPGELLAEELLSSPAARSGSGELRELATHPRFRWWLFTLSHSSIVMVPSGSPGSRTIIKLSFREPIFSEMSWRTGLGWKPYTVLVDSSFIGAQSFHFEAQAPAGLRIDGAALASDRKTEWQEGMLRRAHLYLPNAEQGRAATAVLDLRVAGSGFVRDAWLASLLVTAAIGACLIWAPNIVRNSSSAPALLLLLPGLIATYLGRPDHHGLTQRLLAWTRRTLMFSALLAYATAARVALSGPPPAETEVHDEVQALRCFLWVVLACSAVASGILVVARSRSDHLVRSAWAKLDELFKRGKEFVTTLVKREFTLEEELDGEPDLTSSEVQRVARELCGPDAQLEQEKGDSWSFRAYRAGSLVYREIDVQLHPARDGTWIECRGFLRSQKAAALLDPLRTLHARRQAGKAFEELVAKLSAER